MNAGETLNRAQETKKYTEQLKAGLPGLTLDGLEILGDGWDHVAVEVNGIIFRLPKDHKRNPQREAHVRYEVATLKMLQPNLDVAIPTPDYVSHDFEFFGYPKLSGVIASSVKDKLNQQQINQYLHDWIELAAAIHHAITVSQAAGIGVPALDLEKQIHQAEKVFGIDTTPDLAIQFAHRIINMAKTRDLSKHPKVFLHNDLHSENILLNPDTFRISGVIDWSDMSVGPPEAEFARIVGNDSTFSLESAAELYQQQTGTAINLKLAKIIQHLLWLRVYNYQHERGELAGAKETEAKILQWAEKNP